jgi:micrococcal nuclease
MGNYKSSIKTIYSLILVLVWILFSSAQAQQIWRTCVKVIDGDTVVLDGNEIVRLIGIDTPETKDPRKPVQYYGREAYEFTKRLVEGKKVRLAYDLNKKDKYGRTLAYVYLENGTFLNAEVVKQGYGFAYRYFLFKYFDEFKQYEREARANEIGLWSDGRGEELPVAYENASDIVYITRTGQKYHKEGCGSLRRSKIPIFLYEACKRRYAPCSNCNPPECE